MAASVIVESIDINIREGENWKSLDKLLIQNVDG